MQGVDHSKVRYLMDRSLTKALKGQAHRYMYYVWYSSVNKYTHAQEEPETNIYYPVPEIYVNRVTPK